MTTVQPDWETGTLYVGGLSFLLIILFWLGWALLLIMSKSWQTKLIGWALLLTPLIHYWKDGWL